MGEWEGTKYGLLPNMAGKHELEKIKLREEIARLKEQAESIASVSHCSKPECIEVAKAYLEQDAEITRLKEDNKMMLNDICEYIKAIDELQE